MEGQCKFFATGKRFDTTVSKREREQGGSEKESRGEARELTRGRQVKRDSVRANSEKGRKIHAVEGRSKHDPGVLDSTRNAVRRNSVVLTVIKGHFSTAEIILL